MKIIEGPFDPITQEELEYLLKYRKEHKLKTLYVSVTDEGVLSKKQRYDLLKKSFRPYQHLCVYKGKQQKEDLPSIYLEGEEKVRHGCFFLASRGIKKTLNENGYYYEEIAKYLCNGHRYLHSISVAKTAYQLAEMHHLDANKAYRMGLLHDITKRWSDEEGERILSIYQKDCLKYDPKVWHSFTAPIFIQKNLCLNDKTIYHAIWHHTLGDGKSDYDHILYIADKIEPLRGYDTTKEWELSRISLKQAAHYVLEQSNAYRKKMEKTK